MKELVEEYLGSLTNQVATLEQSLAENRLDLLVRLSHQIKGSAEATGFPSFPKLQQKRSC